MYVKIFLLSISFTIFSLQAMNSFDIENNQVDNPNFILSQIENAEAISRQLLSVRLRDPNVMQQELEKTFKRINILF